MGANKATAKKLKDKHANNVWIDKDGDIWFWSTDYLQWVVIVPEQEGGWVIVPEEADRTYGPYTLLAEGNA